MVIAAARPEVSTSPRPLSDFEGAATPGVQVAPQPLTNCYRCGTRLVMGYDEPECMSCGWVDYSQTTASSASSNGASSNGASIISAATKYVLRYCGDFSNLAGTLVYARVVRIRNRVAYAVHCPFCDQVMEQSSLSGKRPDAREQRYKCSLGHRVSLVPAKRGMLGWR